MNKFVAPLNPMPPIPIGTKHPGAFGINRHEHVHTGVDLYAPYGCPVKTMEAGKIIAIEWFTGPSVKMPWWNNTRAVYIESETGVLNYGEIQELPNLKIGDSVKQGQYIGYVLTVLKKYKGRPMSMLHLECYDNGYTDTWGEWKIGKEKPEHLNDITPLLLDIPGVVCCYEDPYLDSVNLFLKQEKVDKKFDFKSEQPPVETLFGQIYKEVK
jgi:murein DD-endopeptidase MepM/ murein hydrolase activator NlpD